MSFYISDAIAAATTTTTKGAQGDSSFSLIMIAAIFVLFYFMLIRPQNKRAKEHRELVGKIKKGDEIVTSGGILGKVTSLDEQYIKISVSEGVEVSLQRSAISSVLPKGTLKAL
jgi:preprotein translocase subunit YajC